MENLQTLTSKPKRPISIILVQVLCTVTAILLAIGLFKTFSSAIRLNPEFIAWGTLGFEVGWRLALLVLVVATIICIQKKCTLGRQLSTVTVFTFLFLVIYRQIFIGSPVTNSAEATGNLIAISPILYWLYAVGFSAKAKAFFTST